jgi:Taurine catabolism dioxygenase TauD, TfdA family
MERCKICRDRYSIILFTFHFCFPKHCTKCKYMYDASDAIMAITIRHSLQSVKRIASSTFTRKRWLGLTAKYGGPAPHKILALPRHFLRAMDSSNFDPDTGQRIDVAFDANDGRPVLQQPETTPLPMLRNDVAKCTLTPAGDYYRIDWEDGHVSHYPRDWVELQLKNLPRTNNLETRPSHIDDRWPWSYLNEEYVRSSDYFSLPFDQALTDAGMDRALASIYKYGILLVTKTPTQDQGAGIAALASAFSGGTRKTKENSILANYLDARPVISLPHGTDGPLRTLYGTVWSTTSSGQSAGASVADSAYGHGSLPLHTDMTYLRDPPGLQIFTMSQPALQGGQSVFGDGLFAAETLRKEDPKAFQLLSTLKRRHRSIDKDTGWHLEATGPVIQTNDRGNVVMIRHNDLDRLPDISVDDNCVDRVARAHTAWNAILARDETRLVMSLQPGDTVVVANQV